MSRRVYLPVSAADLATLVDEGRLTGPLRAHAVTEVLRDGWADAGAEDHEYVALMAAAAEAADGGRRRVIAADVDEVLVEGFGDATEVSLTGDLSWSAVVAAHVDVGEWSGDEDDDLAWFARQEIAALVG